MNLSRVLIANRGEIAVRVIRACKDMGLETVLATSAADRDTLGARLADRTICIGPPPATESYLNVNIIITAALATGCDALHPGYGFLAESPELAQGCSDNGIVFAGPGPEQIRSMGNKLEARALAREAGVPMLTGSEKVGTHEEAEAIVESIGLPIMIKAAAGGGGRGMQVVYDRKDVKQAFTSASAEARTAFNDDTLYIERFIPNARHIEVQVLGDTHGNVVHLGERDCSIQRRHQKLIEEAPAPTISDELREDIWAAAVKLAHNIAYQSAGTVEFLYDEDDKAFYFLEMNTRIQVEHPVSEAITGIDLVQEQIRVASGEALSFQQSDITFNGHAIECRINAEIPHEGFRPDPGRLNEWVPPQGNDIRLDTHCYAGYTVPIFYDSMIAKLIIHAEDRSKAVERMAQALREFRIEGIGTTIPFMRHIMNSPNFVEGRVNTNLVDKLIQEYDG